MPRGLILPIRDDYLKLHTNGGDSGFVSVVFLPARFTQVHAYIFKEVVYSKPDWGTAQTSDTTNQ